MGLLDWLRGEPCPGCGHRALAVAYRWPQARVTARRRLEGRAAHPRVPKPGSRYDRCLHCGARWVQEVARPRTPCPDDEWLLVVGPDPLPRATGRT